MHSIRVGTTSNIFLFPCEIVREKYKLRHLFLCDTALSELYIYIYIYIYIPIMEDKITYRTKNLLANKMLLANTTLKEACTVIYFIYNMITK